MADNTEENDKPTDEKSTLKRRLILIGVGLVVVVVSWFVGAAVMPRWWGWWSRSSSASSPSLEDATSRS
jgi:hypothetical protein